MRVEALCFVGLTACAAAQAPVVNPAGESSAPVSVSLRVPKVFPALPDRPLLDLGPVLAVPAHEPYEILAVAADQLGADGFVLEGRQIHEIYPTLFSGTGGQIVAALLTGMIPLGEGYRGAPMRKSVSGFYRAFRYLDRDAQAVPVQAAPVSPALQSQLAAATLQDQLYAALGLLAAGAIDQATYERLRVYLLGAADS